MNRDLMLVYDAVKEKLGTEYENVFFQTMREDKQGDVGIYLYESSNDAEDLSGDDIYNCIKIQVQVNSEQSEEGLKTALNYLTSFVERIENEASNVDGIEFISAQHIGPRAIPIGKNDFNIIVCKSTIDLKYIFTM
jgi:hypothetical protein